MAGTHILLQYGDDFRNMRFEDLEGRLAFTLQTVDENPNLVLRLARESAWVAQHSEIMGPTLSFFYFGPARSPGYLAYGNNPTQPMAQSRRQKSTTSTSKYFSTLSGVEYKWRISPDRLECVDSKGGIMAVWETAQPGDEFQARLNIKHNALPMVTEVLTTLLLNRIALSLNW